MTTKSLEFADLRAVLVQMLSHQLKLPDGSIDGDRPLTHYGLDSIAALMIAGDLEDRLGFELPSTLLWDCPTIDALAAHLTGMSQTHRAGAACAQP